MATKELEALAALTSGDPEPCPSITTFAAYPNGNLSVPDGSDHRAWTIAIGKDETATIIMHKAALQALQEMAA